MRHDGGYVVVLLLDDLKWFGEGFDGFPKRLPDDTVEYVVFVIDPKSSEAQIRERLRSIESAADALSKNLLKDYIWQREPFDLQLKREDGCWLLRGTTNYGDSVADEWLIVYLLRELSKQFPEAWIRLYDTDGEFLLVEAANVLPKWLNPEIAENRVWLNQAKLRIIPLEEEKRPLTVQEAREFIKSSPSKLVHSPLIEEEAFYRIRNYPAEISQTLHHSLVTIPRRLAFLLRRNTAYISPAVEAFYLRDPISLRPLKKEDGSALKFPPKDLVTVSVRFTKVGFAQLKSQQFAGPKIWEAELAGLKPGQERDRLEMGMKLACGFDMLLADPQNQDKRTVREIQLLLEDVDAGEEELPTDDAIAKWDSKEDGEEWMDINYEEFEKELQGKGTQGFGDKAAQANLQKMVQRFESFLNDGDAGADGAEMDDMDVDDDDDDSDISSDEEDKAASFDEEEFSKMMREMMGMPEEVYKEVMEMPLDELKAAKENKSKMEEISARIQQQDDEKKRPYFGPEKPPLQTTTAELSSDDEDAWGEDEEKEFRRNMEAMEAELRQSGALDLDPKTKEGNAVKGKGKARAVDEDGPDKMQQALQAMDAKLRQAGAFDPRSKGKARAVEDEDVEEIQRSDDDEEEEVDVDYNLVKNMLDAFKAQGGMAGPAGNMMRAMGLNMPRDEPED
ncbi:SGT1 protein-domain-containing protein [Phyllosticta capitalensis]|uniref:SGT1 protein-domain-containing protein n=1 Tax=Phyllosticta capitalensis TaxID=121624 RepID=UPI0031317598